MQYVIRRADQRPSLNDGWVDPQLPTLEVNQFHAESSDHRPRTRARVLYDDAGLYVFFDVQDRYVLSQVTEHQGNVCRDACVEFFVQPKPDKGYFNFEVNCGGTVLLHYTIRRVPGEPAKATLLGPEWIEQLKVFHTMPKVVDPEIAGPVGWRIAYFVPFALFEAYVGPVTPVAGTTWRANFYKCASSCSHPHWASWSPIGEKLSFHRPETFAPIVFDA